MIGETPLFLIRDNLPAETAFQVGSDVSRNQILMRGRESVFCARVRGNRFDSLN